ncbi:MAG: cytochrome b, partial [Sulfurifustaceae bacterium]
MNVVDRVVLPARDASAGYTLTAVVLHWVLVAVIFAQIGLGWYMTGLPQGPARSWYFALHKSLGLTAALLIAARVVWRLTHAAPPLPAWFPAWQARAARVSHRRLSACMIM